MFSGSYFEKFVAVSGPPARFNKYRESAGASLLTDPNP